MGRMSKSQNNEFSLSVPDRDLGGHVMVTGELVSCVAVQGYSVNPI